MLAATLAAAALGGSSTEPPSAALAQEPPPPAVHTLTATEMFELAGRAEASGDHALAERVLKALVADKDVQIRSEARFRLAQLHLAHNRLSEAAILMREILDEQGDAQRVRIELARILELMGDEPGARRLLREAQAGGLPPDVARFVDRYSAALRAQKPLGASIDISIAPDTNINRATRSQTLGTVIGDFVVDEDARERSGVGVALRGQTYARLPLGGKANLLGRISGSADLYGAKAFNDIALAASAGPELRLGADRLSLEAGGLWRWYGRRRYSRAATASINYFHPLGRTAQLRVIASVALTDNRLNRLLDGETYSASLSYERALSSRSGLGVTLAAERQALRDPGYANWGGQLTVFGYREFGPVTMVATLAHGRLEADKRILLYPERRSDRLYRASLGATLRNFRIGSFAPFVRATFERNRSSVELYDYRRLRAEVGVTRSF